MKSDKQHLIYIVDDDRNLNIMIKKFLEKQGFTRVFSFFSGEELMQKINFRSHPIIIQDFSLPGINGLDLIRKIKKISPQTEFIFLSGQSSLAVAVDAIKLGAFDYIVKDSFSKENVTIKINNLLKIKELNKEIRRMKVGLSIFITLLLMSWIGLYILFTKSPRWSRS